MMLGFLPCGLSFAAFARALASANPWSGAALVFFFGIGTLPGLLVLGTGGAGIIRRYRVQSEILAGLLMIAMAARLAVGAIVRIG
jgi:sulfite exporter TauE/SafE